MTKQRKLKIAVIGAGVSGIMAVVKLRQIGQTDIQVFEKASDIGGTWRDNRYPGVACDVPSHLYRYSFAPNAEWSRVCASGSEILAYVRNVYTEHEIAPLVRFNAEVIESRYDDDKWTLKTKEGAYGPFDAVITAMGILRYPVVPNIEGLNTFAGTMFHTGRWNDEASLDGKRVGIIGTGSTATQIVPAIADRVGRLSLFQRTPQWILPLPNTVIPEEEKEGYRRDPELLQARYDQLSHEFNSKFAAAVVGKNPRVYERMVQIANDNLENSVKDPVLREKLRPSYKVGCKRLVMSDGFYEAVQKSNVELVTDPIENIESRGVRTADGKLLELDLLILATGYDAHSTLFPMQLVGENGVTIDEAWKDAHEAYLGVTIPGFPNFFMIGGPNSPIGNFSFLMTAENQCGYAVNLIKLLAAGEAKSVVPKVAAMKAFNAAVKEQMLETVWTTGCRSWYMDKNGNISSWPWTYEYFEEVMKTPNLEDLEVTPAVAH
ncbi:cyclohexanone monooxygenase [Paraburkholderia sp. HC6.4b]|uniref:flavin-containing monooxygenase n=1 Tax=unclassified Paraburkholderia TaxID=2615204 RepID=UPI00160E18B3|nr:MULTISPECIES: NAD(P)/FAD-dependent oxidoreductase [unclassified Paraburkholderia]MBB5406314.1 cyclohexanone monooxygenase [Paraburkholderia sp. HC6.4b]MBB5448712.1 cyclohexanone monooxygenase [Paraburkholderia sp. Kb1A]